MMRGRLRSFNERDRCKQDAAAIAIIWLMLNRQLCKHQRLTIGHCAIKTKKTPGGVFF
jgi:hypothetical protein